MWFIVLLSSLSVVLLVICAASAAYAQDSELSRRYPVMVRTYENDDKYGSMRY